MAHRLDQEGKQYSLEPEDFIAIKSRLCEDPVLRCPDYEQPFTLYTDASGRGIGAVLSQTDEDGKEHPVAYYSRKLLPKFSATEKECLGVVAAVRHFDVYLLGRRFTIVTDHRALKFLGSMQNSNPRLTRWALALQQFDFQVIHRSGTSHQNARCSFPAVVAQ